MNERIKQLAEQAKIEFTYDPTETPMRAFAECWEDDLEKFAELIVLECMYVGRLAQINNQLVDSEIKDHFGVEE